MDVEAAKHNTRWVRVGFDEDTYWRLYTWATREHRKLFEQIALAAVQSLVAEEERQQQEHVA